MQIFSNTNELLAHFDESVYTGNGAYTVVSKLHYIFDQYGGGECDVHLRADNCSG